MIITVGSTRGPKVDAVRRAVTTIAAIAPHFAGAEVVPFDVSTGAPPMPLSTDELLNGARARAVLAYEALRAQGREADLAVGLEAGIELRRGSPSPRGFLMCWAYVTDGHRAAHGCGGALELPESLLEAVIDQGLELGQAIEVFAERMDVRSHEGAWGVLTMGLLDRTRSFELALLNAFAPFYNESAYR